MRRKINSWHPLAAGFSSTSGSMESLAGLGHIRIRCKNSHPPSFLRMEQLAGMG